MVAATRSLLSVVESSAVAHRGHHRLGVLVEQGQVEVELAGEVLVEHRLADPGGVGDVVHRRRVVALGDEDLLGRAEQLLAPGRAGQPGAAGPRVRGRPARLAPSRGGRLAAASILGGSRPAVSGIRRRRRSTRAGLLGDVGRVGLDGLSGPRDRAVGALARPPRPRAARGRPPPGPRGRRRTGSAARRARSRCHPSRCAAHIGSSACWPQPRGLEHWCRPDPIPRGLRDHQRPPRPGRGAARRPRRGRGRRRAARRRARARCACSSPPGPTRSTSRARSTGCCAAGSGSRSTPTGCGCSRRSGPA